MATTIKLKNSVTTTNAPSSLVQGEVAINVTDKKVWVGNAATTPVQLLGTGADGSLSTLTVGAGTVSAPSITTSGDTNTGIFFPAADTIAFSEGGVEAARFDSSGNLGIGTSSPSAFGKLGIVSAAGQNAAGFTDNTNYTFEIKSGGVGVAYMGGASGSALALASNGAERMRIDSSGNVGIGTSSPTQKLQINGNTLIPITSSYHLFTTDYGMGTPNSSGLQIFSADGDSMRFGHRGSGTFTERMRLDDSGNLLVGTTNTTGIAGGGSTNPGVWLAQGLIATQNNGDANIYCSKATGYTSSNYIAFWVSGTLVGSITTNGSVTLYNTTSDYRLKNIVGNISDSGQRIDALEPIEYDWKNGGRTRGFLAHKFAEVYPNSVNGEKDAVDKDGKPVYQAMQASTPEVMADLIAEIQSLRKRVAKLESK